jgi:hypothetical protein
MPNDIREDVDVTWSSRREASGGAGGRHGAAKYLFIALGSRPSCLQFFSLLRSHGPPNSSHARFFLVFTNMRGVIAEGDKSPLTSTRRRLYDEVLRVYFNEGPCLAAFLRQA